MHTTTRPNIMRPAPGRETHQAISYLEDVAYELRTRGLLIAAVEVRSEPRLTGSVRITDGDTATAQRQLTLHWHARNGWWTEWTSAGSRRRVHSLLSDPDTAPVTVACLAADLLA